MKKIVTLLFCFASAVAGAQNVKLETGKKITAVTTGSMDMDMGMGGAMKIASSSTAIINITGNEENQYKGDHTITKMKMTQDGAGQNTTFDSEKQEDRDSEIGKQLGKTVNQRAAILIGKTDGTVKDASPEKVITGGSPMDDLIGASQSPSVAAAAAFFVLPGGKKTGDKWTDSTLQEGIKVMKNFELSALKDGIATIFLEAATKGTVDKTIEGLQMSITMNGTTKSTIITDTNTGLVKSNTSVGKIDASLDMMGQAMPITMTLNTVTVFE